MTAHDDRYRPATSPADALDRLQEALHLAGVGFVDGGPDGDEQLSRSLARAQVLLQQLRQMR